MVWRSVCDGELIVHVLWNELPVNARLTHTFDTFKSEAKSCYSKPVIPNYSHCWHPRGLLMRTLCDVFFDVIIFTCFCRNGVTHTACDAWEFQTRLTLQTSFWLKTPLHVSSQVLFAIHFSCNRSANAVWPKCGKRKCFSTSPRATYATLSALCVADRAGVQRRPQPKPACSQCLAIHSLPFQLPPPPISM